MKSNRFLIVVGVAAALFFPLSSHCFGVEISFKNRTRQPLEAKKAELTDNEIKLIYALSEIDSITPHLGKKNNPSEACLKIFFKKHSQKPIMSKVAPIKAIEITEEDLKLVYPFDVIASVNGITNFNRTKLAELEDLGHRYVSDGKYDEAAELFTKLIELDPSNARMVTHMAIALIETRRHPAAIPYILREIEMNPHSWEAYKRLGNAYRHIDGKNKESIDAYKKVIEIQGPNPVNMFDLGLTYSLRCKKPEEGLPYLEKAVNMDPPSKEVRWFFYKMLGDCYQSLGRYQEAIDAYQKVIEKFSVKESSGKAFYRTYEAQSKAYSALGQTEKAAECRRKAVETGFKDA